MKKVWIVGLIAVLLTLMLCNTASADVIEGLQDAKTELLVGIKTVLDTVVVPILITIVGVVFLFNLLGFLRTRNDGGDHSRQLISMAVTVSIEILLGTWYAWGDTFLGTGTAETVTAAIALLRSVRL